VLRMGRLRIRKRRKKEKESDQPEKQRTARAAENSEKRRTIAHGTAPGLGIVAEEERQKQLIRARNGSVQTTATREDAMNWTCHDWGVIDHVL